MTVQNSNRQPSEFSSPVIVEMSGGDELTELIPQTTLSLPPGLTTDTASPADPEFDAYLAVVKLLLGGTIEGAGELVRRLEKIEAELRASEQSQQEPGTIENVNDVVRYMLVGMTLSMSDGLRRQAVKLAQASDAFWRLTGSAVDPLVENRLTGFFTRPFDRAFDRLVNRGQARVNDWVDLGRTHEPAARLMARQLTMEVIDDFISHLSENEELASLVQEQSVSLATETVDEFRSRTVSADALAENIVRRILRRPPRQELPPPSDGIMETIIVKKGNNQKS
jgi:hypothetical protein